MRTAWLRSIGDRNLPPKHARRSDTQRLRFGKEDVTGNHKPSPVPWLRRHLRLPDQRPLHRGDLLAYPPPRHPSTNNPKVKLSRSVFVCTAHLCPDGKQQLVQPSHASCDAPIPVNWQPNTLHILSSIHSTEYPNPERSRTSYRLANGVDHRRRPHCQPEQQPFIARLGSSTHDGSLSLTHCPSVGP